MAHWLLPIALEVEPLPKDEQCLKKYLRIKKIRDDGCVEFEFSIGDPELFVDLILPKNAFEEFRSKNAMATLSDVDVACRERKTRKYLYGEDILRTQYDNTTTRETTHGLLGARK